MFIKIQYTVFGAFGFHTKRTGRELDEKIAVSIFLVGIPVFGIVGGVSYSLFIANPGSLFLLSRLKTELKHPS